LFFFKSLPGLFCLRHADGAQTLAFADCLFFKRPQTKKDLRVTHFLPLLKSIKTLSVKTIVPKPQVPSRPKRRAAGLPLSHRRAFHRPVPPRRSTLSVVVHLRRSPTTVLFYNAAQPPPISSPAPQNHHRRSQPSHSIFVKGMFSSLLQR
jgi:hypothetical protein